MTVRDGDASRVQTLSSGADMQFYINYTDRNVFVIPPRLVRKVLEVDGLGYFCVFAHDSEGRTIKLVTF